MPTRALTTYTGKRKALDLPMFVPGGRRARLAYNIGAYAYRNRGKFKKAAVTIGRLYRGYRARKGRIGESMRARARSKAIVSGGGGGGFVSKDTKTLYSLDVTDIAQASGGGLNTRERAQVYLSGVRFCVHMRNLGTEPLLVNYAVIHDKEANKSQTFVPATDFFRAAGKTVRTQNFDSTLESIEFNCLNMNTDRFTVLMRKKYALAGISSSTYSMGNYRSWLMKDHWIPIKRKIAFDNGAVSKVWIVYWCDKIGAAAGTAVPNSLQWADFHRTYFRETDNV